MGLFSWIPGVGGKERVVKQELATFTAAECPHTTLTARWDSVHDMGIEDKAIEFICAACDEHFTPEEAKEVRAGEADRLRQQLEGTTESAAASTED